MRSADAVGPEWYAALIALLAGLTYDRASTLAASELLGAARPDLLTRAGTVGVHDPAIARVACQLFEVALQGCAALGAEFLEPHDLEIAREFFDRYTRRGRSPADDVLERLPGYQTATAQTGALRCAVNAGS